MLRFFFAIESHLSRADPCLLSDQIGLELCIAGFTTDIKSEFKADESDEFMDVCEWIGIDCDEGDVVAIDWEAEGLEGTMDFGFLPTKLEILRVSYSELHGTVDIAKFPSSLLEIHLLSNKLTGTVDFTALPDGVHICILNTNHFEGSVDLTRLPKKLRRMSVADNQFTGSVNVSRLPSRLTMPTST